MRAGKEDLQQGGLLYVLIRNRNDSTASAGEPEIHCHSQLIGADCRRGTSLSVVASVNLLSAVFHFGACS